MNTLEEIKKKGWTEVESEQKLLTKAKRHSLPTDIAAIQGRIQGMVFILNMIR